MDENTLFERINLLIELDIMISKVESDCGIANGTLGKVLKGKLKKFREPALSNFWKHTDQLILDHYNREKWLVLGQQVDQYCQQNKISVDQLLGYASTWMERIQGYDKAIKDGPKGTLTTTSTPGIIQADKDSVEKRIAELEKELKSPPKNPLIGLKSWKQIRETELNQLKAQVL